jgi:hypothetical protein
MFTTEQLKVIQLVRSASGQRDHVINSQVLLGLTVGVLAYVAIAVNQSEPQPVANRVELPASPLSQFLFHYPGFLLLFLTLDIFPRLRDGHTVQLPTTQVIFEILIVVDEFTNHLRNLLVVQARDNSNGNNHLATRDSDL